MTLIPRPLQLVFENYDQSEAGSLSGQKVSTPYPSKDHLQQKRYVAQSMGTTYVYDFLELFRQVPANLCVYVGMISVCVCVCRV